MSNFMKKLLVEDWVVVIVSIPLLLIAGLADMLPGNGPKVPSTLATGEAWANIGVLFAIALVVLFIGNKMLKRPLRGLLVSFIVVFAVALLAQWVAKIETIKYYGFEAVFFSVIFGLIIRNYFHIPEWLKPAVQGEFFIKIGVVCLGATILFRDVMESSSVGLLQALVVVCIVWFFAYWLARRLKVDRATAMTLSSGVSICGVSACITAARVAGTDDKKLSYIVSVVLIIVVPMIYLMPWLADMLVPLLSDDPAVQQEIAGAWIGGTIDTTSGVTASSAMVSDEANKVAVIVKATQNVLIGVVAFFIALYLSTKTENKGQSQRPSLGIVWEKFPKFILGFVAASLVFSLCESNAIFPDASKATGLAKTFSTFFFSLAFVCIGLDTRLKDIISKENRNALYAFLGAQCFNIIATFMVAWLLFGIVKPAMSSDDAQQTAETSPINIKMSTDTVRYTGNDTGEEVDFETIEDLGKDM
ncbi:MAG: putative sulfate exporter family transporter [Alistipes sp.]|nr:putative sulfate exporter family transporter [Alistipes sp.]